MYLKSLDLSHNNLTSLPEELGMFLFLECLYLSHNKLGEVPAQDPRWNWIDAYRLTKSLQVLDLSHNEVKLGLVPHCGHSLPTVSCFCS